MKCISVDYMAVTEAIDICLEGTGQGDDQLKLAYSISSQFDEHLIG